MTDIKTDEAIRPLSLLDLLNTLYRRKVFVIATVLLFLILGFAYYKASPKLYMAKAVVLLENQKRDVQIKAVLTTEGNDDTLIPSEIQVLTSRDLMGKVVDKLELVANPSLLTEEPKTVDTESALASLSKEVMTDRRNQMINATLGNLKIRQIERSRAIEVAYEAKNPQIATDIVNTLTKLYIEEQLSSNFDAIRMTNAWLADRVRETQKKVFESDTKVAQYREKMGIIDSRGIDLIEQKITDLTNNLTMAQSAVAATEARMSSVNNGSNLDTAPEILSAPLILSLREREAQSRDDLVALQDQLGASHPKVLTARAQVKEINAKIQQEIKKLAEGMRRENKVAVDNVANIQAQLDQLKIEYNKYKSNNVDLSALESEAATNHAFLETLNLRFKETQSQEDNKFQAPYARIISAAPMPQYPSSPNGKLIMLAALVVGLGLGSGLALALDYMQVGIYNGRQIQEITGKTNIAVVSKAALTPETGIVSYADFPLAAPFSPFMQGIRAITMFMRLEMNKNPSNKIYNFISSKAGEGKSALVVTVARQLALEGLKVLAIDCDIRQTSLSNTFGIMQKSGLNEILKGEAALKDVLFKDNQTGMSIIGIGRPENVNIMSRSLDEWSALINSFASDFDVVLLDTPPVVSFPESRLLAKISSNILCVRWKKTPLKLLAFTLDMLGRLDCTVLGTVITMSETKQNFVQDGYSS